MRRTPPRHDDIGDVLCGGTMVWRQHLVGGTAWMCYARTRVLWCDVNHHAARRDKVWWCGTGILQ